MYNHSKECYSYFLFSKLRTCPFISLQNAIDHPVLKELLKPVRDLYSDVKRKAMMRLEYEGLHKAEAITTPGARFYQDPSGFAMDRYAYYVCFKCKKVGCVQKMYVTSSPKYFEVIN